MLRSFSRRRPAAAPKDKEERKKNPITLYPFFLSLDLLDLIPSFSPSSHLKTPPPQPCGGAIPLCMVDEFDIPAEIIDRKVTKMKMISPSNREVDVG